MSPLLEGCSAVITGASQGLGKVIAETFVEEGASVLLCARGEDLLLQVCEELKRKASTGIQVIAWPADVSRPEDAEALRCQVEKSFPRLDILVNNAGVLGPKGVVEELDWEEWVRTIQINFLGAVLLCRAFLPRFKAQKRGKIINLSGGGATSPFPRFTAYACSKAALVRFTETLAEEVRDLGIEVNAVAPGALNTRLLDEVLQAGSKKVGEQYYAKALKQLENGGAPLEKAARLVTWLGSDASDGITGKLISAVWDPWETLDRHKEDLKGDLYTLRRIVPGERGMEWE